MRQLSPHRRRAARSFSVSPPVHGPRGRCRRNSAREAGAPAIDADYLSRLRKPSLQRIARQFDVPTKGTAKALRQAILDEFTDNLMLESWIPPDLEIASAEDMEQRLTPAD